jgi:DNA polymerase-3 subunit chi
MTRVDFYHLQKQTLDEVLPKLLSKAYETGEKILVKVGTAERVEFLNSLLWTFSDDSFLPHGSKKDGFAGEQPIWLTSAEDNPNHAAFLFLVDGAEVEIEQSATFSRIFNIFDGNSEEALNQSRRLWKTYKDGGFEVNYWQQNERGVWEHKI